MASEIWWRLGCFLGVLLAMLVWEQCQPKRQATLPARQRWPANLGIVVVNTLVLRLLIPAGAIGAAVWAQANDIGMFNTLAWPLSVTMLLGFLSLDCAIYWQHRLFHRIPLLWRVHRMHHADTDFDTTTGLRFHPLEIILSMLIKIGIVVAIGIDPTTVLIFEIVLNATSLFNHGNVALPKPLEGPVRALIVTQEMHRIHHSQLPQETNSNYSFNFSIWDRLFGSYTAQAQQGSDGISIGLKDYPANSSSTKLGYLLAIPFRQPPGDAKSDTPSKGESAP